MRLVVNGITRAAQAVVWIGVLIVLYGLVLTGVTIGGTGDSPCGPLLAPRFFPIFNTEQVCGMMHLGTFLLVVGLVIGGCVLAVVAALAARGRIGLTATAWITAALAIAAVLGWAILAWRVSNWDAFHPRGWTPVRNLVGFTSIGLVVAAALTALIVCTAPEPGRSSRSDQHA
jgi:hypothetical protein